MGERLSYSEPLPTAMSLFEKQYISKVLEETKGNKTLASKTPWHIEKKPFGRSANCMVC